jgi:hypothetical protein
MNQKKKNLALGGLKKQKKNTKTPKTPLPKPKKHPI